MIYDACFLCLMPVYKLILCIKIPERQGVGYGFFIKVIISWN